MRTKIWFPNLKPLKILTVVAFVLHVVSIFAVVVVTALQVPIKNFLHFSHRQQGALFIMPSMIFIAAATVALVFHAALAAGFMRNFSCDYASVRRLKIVSIITVIFVVIVQPFIESVSRRIDITLLSRSGLDYFSEAIVTMNFLYNVLVIRFIALSVLLMGAAMSLYFCYLQRVKQHPYQQQLGDRLN